MTEFPRTAYDINRVLRLWDEKFDTVSIAKFCGITEHEAERILWKARELRKQRAGAWGDNSKKQSISTSSTSNPQTHC